MDEHGPWIAHINHGRWVAECPRPRCGWAYLLKPDQGGQICQTEQGDGCRYAGTVRWPGDAAAISTELALRPVEADRNWAPAGHPQTFRSRTPDGRVVAEVFPRGETVADLRRENGTIEALPPEPTTRDETIERANAALADLGFVYDPAEPGHLRRL